MAQPVTSSALLSSRVLVSQQLSWLSTLQAMTESATLPAVARRQPLLAGEERCSFRKKMPASEAQQQASVARWFERRDQALVDSERPAAQVKNSRPHAKALNSLTHAEVLKSMALKDGYSLFCLSSL